MNKITVYVDLDDTEMLEEHSYMFAGISQDGVDRGIYGVDRDGVYHMCYHNESFGTVKTYLVKFYPQIELCSKELDGDNWNKGYACEYCSSFTCNCEEIIDQNIQAQERTGQQ